MHFEALAYLVKGSDTTQFLAHFGCGSKPKVLPNTLYASFSRHISQLAELTSRYCPLLTVNYNT